MSESDTTASSTPGAGSRHGEHSTHDSTPPSGYPIGQAGRAAPGDPWSPWAASSGPGGTQTLPHPGSPGDAPPPTHTWTPSTDGGDPRRRRSSTGLVALVLVGALVTSGIGGVVGYEIASSGSSGTSVLSGSSSSSSAPDAAPGSVEAVAQKVLPSVVQLKGPSGEGSGIVISADGLILTNAHVLEAGQSQSASQSPFGNLFPSQEQQGTTLQAVFQNGQTATVTPIGTDATADLAVVRAQNVSGLTPASIGSSGNVRVGQNVVAVGSPLGLSGTVTSGIVSALQRPVNSSGQGGQTSVTSAIQTDASINPGNSGGALTDMNGQVIGITSSIASLGSGQSSGGGGQSGSIGLGFAIPIDQAKRIGDELIRNGFANQAVLGVSVPQSGQGGSSLSTGARIGDVQPNGAAAAAGLKAGDVVTRLNGQVIDDGDALIAAVRAQNPGAQVTMTVSSDGGAPRPVPVTLGTERAPSAGG